MNSDKKTEGVYENNYDKLISYLDLIVINQTTKEYLSVNKDFKTDVLRYISYILNFEEENKESNVGSKFVIAYETITSEKFVKVENLTNDQDVLEDDIGYLKTKIQNNLKIDLDELLNKNNKQDSNNEEPIELEDYEEPKKENDSNYSNYSNFNNQNNWKTNDFEEAMITQQAKMLLNYDISKGSVYKFKSKPEAIPILKFVFIALIAALVVIGFVVFAYNIIISQHVKIWFVPPAGSNINAQTVPFLRSPFPLDSLILLGTLGVTIYTLVKSWKNDNSRFRFSLISSLIVLMFVVFPMLSDISTIVRLKNVFWETLNDTNTLTPNDTTTIGANNSKYIWAVNAYLISNYVLFGFGFLSCLIIVLGFVLNPKTDVERLNELLTSYISDIRAGTRDFDISNDKNGFSKFGF